MQNKKALIAGIIAIGILLLFVIFIYMPKHRLVLGLRAQIKKIDEEVEINREMMGDARRFGRMLVDMQKEVDSFEKRIPDREKCSSILSEFSSLARLHSVEVVSIKSEDPLPLFDDDGSAFILSKKQLKKLPVNLKIQARYRKIAEYIRSIQESVNMLATIDEVIITRNEKEVPLLDVELVLDAYLLDKD